MSWDVRCTSLGKRYRVRDLPARRRLRDLVRPPTRDVWALRNVTFEVASGEVLGIIGPNGAGKSTLLKVLSSITAPSEGEIRIRGRLAALIEVGSGFHPELTGRENVFLSGTILGMRRREIAARLDSIADFAAIGRYLDVPVKWYSSGMYVRLGFAVAAHLETDVLLVDEVLAVGDAEFQARCLRRIQELRDRGATIVFISHDLGTVERMCHRALLLRGGEIAVEGPARDVVTRYQRMVTDGDLAAQEPPPAEGQPVEITRLEVLDASGRPSGVARSGDAAAIDVVVRAHDRYENAVVQAMVYSYEDGVLLFECGTPPEGFTIEAGESIVRFQLDALRLLPGAYTLGAIVRPSRSERAVAWWFGRTTLHVDSGPRSRGRFHAPYHWSVVRPLDVANVRAGSTTAAGASSRPLDAGRLR
jgi:lipopolysaccharide transport system ATP-binding protein